MNKEKGDKGKEELLTKKNKEKNSENDNVNGIIV